MSHYTTAYQAMLSICETGQAGHGRGAGFPLGACRFRTDGSISVAVQAGGFMETLYWEYPQTAGDLPFGTVVGKNIMAPLHDHLAGSPPAARRPR